MQLEVENVEVRRSRSKGAQVQEQGFQTRKGAGKDAAETKIEEDAPLVVPIQPL